MSLSIFDKFGLSKYGDTWRAAGTILLKPSGDLNDYIELSTTSDRPLISGAGNYLVLGKDGTAGSATSADDILVGAKLEIIGAVTSVSTTGFATTATFVPDSSRTNYAYSIGNRTTELTVNLDNAASQNFEPFQMNINLTASAGAPTSTSTARLLRIRSTHDTADMANLRIMNINTYMDVRKNIQAAYGQMNGVDFFDNTIAITTEAAVGVFNMDCDSTATVTGNCRGIIINMHGASLPSTSIGLEVRTDGGAATLTEGVRIWSVGSCSINYGLYIDGTINTADIRLTSGGIIASAGTIKIQASGDTDDYITFGTNAENVPTIYGTGAYLRIGDAGTTNHSFDSEDDLMVTGKLEAKGLSYFDANVEIVGSFVAKIDNAVCAIGGGIDFKMIWETADANAHGIRFGFPAGGGTNVPVLGLCALTAQLYSDWGLFDGVTQPTIAAIEKGTKVAGVSNATSTGADTTITTATAGTFDNVVAGDIVRVTAGTNATAGWYFVDAKTDGTNIVVDRNWCTGAVSGGTLVLYHDFTMLSADGICTRITDGAPTDSSIEIDRDGWMIGDAKGDLLYMRLGGSWLHFTPDGGSPSFAGLTLTGDTVIGDTLNLDAGATTGDYFAIRGFDTGNTMVEVARVAGAADPYFSTGGSQQFKFYNSGIAYFGGLLFMGDSNITAEGVMGITTGIQIDQGASDDAVLVFKSSDVAHGGTGLADTDTFAYFKKVASASGGLLIRTYKDADDGNNSAFLMESYLAENVDTTKSTSGRAIIEIKGAQISGTAQANVVADGNVFAIRGRVGGADTSLAIFDEDGDLWLNGGILSNNFIAKKTTVTNQTNAGVETYSAAEMLGGLITRDPNGDNRTDTTDTAANIVAAIGGAAVGTSFEFTIKNTADAAETITVAGGTNVTITGTATIAQNNTKRFLCVLTNVTASSEAATIYSLGTIVH